MLRQALKLSIGVAAIIGVVSVAQAAEVRLRMRGGGFEINGDLARYDGTSYTINSPVFGSMTLDATRFECVGTGCPTAPVGVAVASFAASAPRGRVSGSIAIVGSNTIGEKLMPALIASYARSTGADVKQTVGQDATAVTFDLVDASGRALARMDLERRGSGSGFKALLERRAAVAMADRPITNGEVASLAAAGLGDMRAPDREHVLGLDGIIVAVAPNSPAVSLSLDSIAKIFAGQITDWSQVGLPAGAIHVYAPNPGSGTASIFEAALLAPRGLTFGEPYQRRGTNRELSDAVASDPAGITFVGMAYQRNARALNLEQSCGLVTQPTHFSVKTEEYPLRRRLFIYTTAQGQSPLARGLVAFALSDAAQPAVREADFVDQSPELLSFDEQGTRIAYALNAPSEDFDFAMMRQLIGVMTPAQRLTTTFRFESGSFVLDSKARDDITRLRDELAKPQYRGKQVLLLGFADSVGLYQANTGLAQRRAQAVAQVLRAGGALPVAVDVAGYSELAPVACNDTVEGRSLNRRVEVWIR